MPATRRIVRGAGLLALLLASCGKPATAPVPGADGGEPTPTSTPATSAAPAEAGPTTTALPVTTEPPPPPASSEAPLPTTAPRAPPATTTSVDRCNAVAEADDVPGKLVVRSRCTTNWAAVLVQPPTDAPAYVTILHRTEQGWIFDRSCHDDVLSVAECVLDLGSAVADELALVGETYARGAHEIEPAGWPAQCASPARHAGDSGVCVAKLQTMLVLATGADIAVDGRFGPATSAAVTTFQAASGLEADGYAGPATWAALLDGFLGGAGSDPAAAPEPGAGCAQYVTDDEIPISMCAKGATVSVIQERLELPADGYFGPATADAIRRFQAAAGLAVTGIVDAATWSVLGLGTAR